MMKNRVTTTITTMMLMLFCSGINVIAQSEYVAPSRQWHETSTLIRVVPLYNGS